MDWMDWSPTLPPLRYRHRAALWWICYIMNWMRRCLLCYSHCWSHPSRPSYRCCPSLHCPALSLKHHTWWSCPASFSLLHCLSSSASSSIPPFSPSAPPVVPLRCTDPPGASQSSTLPWLVDPAVPAQASKPWTPPRPTKTLAPPWLNAHSTPPWNTIPKAPPGSLIPLGLPWSVVTPAPLRTSESSAASRTSTPLALPGSSFPPALPWS